MKGIIWKTMKSVLDLARQVKQVKTQTESIGKPRMIDHNEIIAAPIEDNIDDGILVVEKHPSNTRA